MTVLLSILGIIGRVLLWIAAGILCLLALGVLLLCVPVYVRAEYGTELGLTVRYGLIPIRILPLRGRKERAAEETGQKKPARNKKQAKPPREKKARPPLKQTLAKYGIPEHLPDTLHELLLALLELGRLGNDIRRSLTICRLRIVLVCGGSDAAQAAIHYGQAWPLLTGLEQALGLVLRLKHFEGTPVLDYSAPEQIWRGEIVVRFFPVRITAAAVWRGLRIFGGYRRVKKLGQSGGTEQPVQQAEKGVTVHEQSGT